MFTFPTLPHINIEEVDLIGDCLDEYRQEFKKSASDYIKGAADPYSESVSIHQRSQSHFGSVWESVWAEAFKQAKISYERQPKTSSRLRADFKVGQYVIDTTLSIRERGDGKLKYQHLYPDCTIVIISNDTKISSERVKYFHNHKVRLVLRPELACHYLTATSFQAFLDEIAVQYQANN